MYCFVFKVEVAEEIAARTKLERSRQDEVRLNNNRRRSTSIPASQITTIATAPPVVVNNAMTSPTTPTTGPSTSTRVAGRPKRTSQRLGSSPSNSRNKKEKVYCICRTPYDETKFYVGCDLCNNWFHGQCVSITEESSKSMSEFICDECKRARETQELFCLCKQPYDESQ